VKDLRIIWVSKFKIHVYICIIVKMWANKSIINSSNCCNSFTLWDFFTDDSKAALIYTCQYLASQDDNYIIGDSFEPPSDVCHGQAATNKLWDIDVLFVHILNPEDLARFDLNQQNIMDWADKWKRKTRLFQRSN